MSPRSPFFKLEPKNPLPARPAKDDGQMGPLPFGATATPAREKSPLDVARDGYQVVERGGARPAYEGPRYDPDEPFTLGRFT